MNIVEFDESGGALLRQLGAGRGGPIEWAGTTVELSVHHLAMGGEGLMLTRARNGESWSVWVDEPAWCEWIAPLVPAPSFDAVPLDLRTALAAWTLAPLLTCLDDDTTPAPVFDVARQSCPARADWVVTLTVSLNAEARTVRLRLLDWPTARLASLLNALEPLPPPARPDHRVALSLIAGAVELRGSQLAGLTAGAGLVLDWACDIEAGRFCLFQRKQLAFLSQLETGAWQVDDLLNEVETMQSDADAQPAQSAPMMTNSQAGAAALNDVTFTVVAEVAQAELSLSQLASLETGDLLDMPAAGDGRVTLKVNQRTIGHGRLIRIGERVMVRIED